MKHFFKNSFKCVRAFQIELEFGSVGFLGEEEIGALEKNFSEQGQQHTQPIYGFS